MTPTPIRLYNSLTKQKETFSPNQEGHVSMYHCGPTVYNYAHIGNLRAYIAADILRRVFELNGYDVAQVMNITDIGHLQHDEIDDGDDKMTLALRREGMDLNRENMKLVALKYFEAFRTDIQRVNILPATLYPFASDHIAEDISFIQNLLDKGNAYAAEDGIYFDTTSLPDPADYGRLGGIASDDAQSESRIGDDAVAKSKKRNIRDFALWKFDKGAEGGVGYDAAFGKGFPGWHIECSVMSMKYLGGLGEFATTSSHSDVEWRNFQTFDIHTGGVDHIPVHHNNEIAQTEAISSKPLAKYWLHNAHLIIEGGKKMAKSGEAFITLQAIEDKGVSALGFRYWTLGAGYRTPLQFSFEALEDAERSYRGLVARVAAIRKQAEAEHGGNIDAYMDAHSEAIADATAEKTRQFKELVNDDLNTPKALAFTYEEIINSADLPSLHKMHLIATADTVFGLDLIERSKDLVNAMHASAIVPDEIRALAEKRLAARAEKDWATSDRLRDEIAAQGYEIKDDANVENGYIVTKKLV